ncbi:MAG: 2TM domain-containing protein [Bacteroidetes bacterium]|nr:2TM domain-containing protein [Bacteroidota bacterium]MBS1629218.1 2TM domain-containing protein [Bacteroidota bacterium]
MSHNRIIPTAAAKRNFFIHAVIFVIGVVTMVMMHKSEMKAQGGWAYPWHAWVIAAWSLGIVGHMCALWTSYEDPGMLKYEREKKQG